MAPVHFNIRSRSSLLLLASVSLLLTNLHLFLAVPHRLSIIATLLSLPVIWFVVWNLYLLHNQHPAALKNKTSTHWNAALFAITGTALLLSSRFFLLKPALHGAFNIAGWLLILGCCSFPIDGAQAFAISGVCLIALCDIHWETYTAFRDAPIYTTITLAAIWLAVSGLTYMYLSRQKALRPRED